MDERRLRMTEYLNSQPESLEKGAEKEQTEKPETEIEQPKNLETAEGKKEKVIEKAKAKRVELFKKIFLSRAFKMVESPLFLKIANYAPIIGDATLLVGAIRGKEGGRKLSPGERLNYVAAVSMSVMAYISLHEGNLTAAGIEQAITLTLINIDTIPVALKKSAKALENKAPKISHMMDATADYMLTKREELANLGKMFTQDSIITLGLSNYET